MRSVDTVPMEETNIDNMDDINQNQTSSASTCRAQQAFKEDLITELAAHTPSTRVQEALETRKEIPPTLLSIPQELRDIIFAHIFTLTSPNATTDLRIVPCDNIRQDVRAGTLPHEPSPPSKNLLLVCRQLNTELKQAHATAYRHYWGTQTFHITGSRPFILSKLRPISNLDLRHIHRLTIAPMLKRTRIKILIIFCFEPTTSSWSTTIERSPGSKPRVGEEDVPWQLTDCAQREAFLRILEDTINGLRRDDEVPTKVDPAAGRGLDAREMYELSSAVWMLTLQD
jgi:hypothetical protein